MKRRSFLKSATAVAGASFSIGGIPLGVLSNNKPLQRLAAQSDNDRALVIVQLHGGNDGLNTFIPIDQYDDYYNYRPNLAIPERGSIRSYIPLDSNYDIGLHPDMGDFKALYEQGLANIIQNVSYKFSNGSHFRGRDIQFMGGDHDEYLSSGWVGRYLEDQIAPLKYPADFPNADNLDPLAIEMGRNTSLIFHQDKGVPASYSISSDPESFANLIGRLKGFNDEGIDPRGLPPSLLSNTKYGDEMDFLLNLENTSEQYAERLQEIYSNTQATDAYPIAYPYNAPRGLKQRNRLSEHLQLIARLIEGGAKTKVYLVRLGGFDTHADQVTSYDRTMGVHSALLYHLCSSIRAFQNDLKARGVDHKVLTMTTSEFGRRIASNGSFGTDHGVAAPIMLFGSGVIPGVVGNNPTLRERGNVEMEFDYRQVYNSILKNWFEVDQDKINDVILRGNFNDGSRDNFNFSPLDIVKSGPIVAGSAPSKPSVSNGISIYPNIAIREITLRAIKRHIKIQRVNIISADGKVVRKSSAESASEVVINIENLAQGNYIVEIQDLNGHIFKSRFIKK